MSRWVTVIGALVRSCSTLYQLPAQTNVNFWGFYERCEHCFNGFIVENYCCALKAFALHLDVIVLMCVLILKVDLCMQHILRLVDARTVRISYSVRNHYSVYV